MIRNLFLIFLLSTVLSACTKEWEPPIVYTANTTLLYTPDSIDENGVYYYQNGMALKINLTISESGSVVYNSSVKNLSNYHFGDSISNPIVTASVVKISTDTSLHLQDYPVLLRVYKDIDLLFSENGVDVSFSF